MSDTLKIVVLHTFKDGKDGEYFEGQEIELPMLEALMYIKYGWVKDISSGRHNPPVMHVFVQPEDETINFGVE